MSEARVKPETSGVVGATGPLSRVDAKARMLSWGEQTQQAIETETSRIGSIAARGALGVGGILLVARILRGPRRAKATTDAGPRPRTRQASLLRTLAALLAERVVESAIRSAVLRLTKPPRS